MLNDMKSGECELCGGVRHVDVGVNGDNNHSRGQSELVKEQQLHKRSSNATGGSKSSESKHSKQSEVSKRSTLDPPAECNAKSAAADKKRVTATTTRQSDRGNRRPSTAKKDGPTRRSSHINTKNTKSNTKIKTNESITHNSQEPISGTAAIQSLSSAPLAGEGTTHAIAALLGLTQELSINNNNNNNNGTDHADNSKNSGSKGSGSNRKESVKSEVSDTAKQNNKTQNEGGGKRRTTFSHEVHDISNGIKLNKKIQGGRERADKIKAVKRGEIVVEGSDDKRQKNDVDDNRVSLCAEAEPFVPGLAAEEKKAEDEPKQHQLPREQSKKHGAKKGGKGKKKNAKNDKDQSSYNEKQAPSKVAEVKADEIQNNKLSKKKGQRPIQNNSEPATGVSNLTLHAIQQSKQQQKKSSVIKQKTDTSDRNGAQTGKSDLNDTPKIDKDKKKTLPKTSKIAEKNSKQNQKKNIDKSPPTQEKSTNPNKKTKAASKTPTNSLSPKIPPNQPQTTNDLNYGADRPIVVVHIAEKPSIAQVSRPLPTCKLTSVCT